MLDGKPDSSALTKVKYTDLTAFLDRVCRDEIFMASLFKLKCDLKRATPQDPVLVSLKQELFIELSLKHETNAKQFLLKKPLAKELVDEQISKLEVSPF